MGGSGNSDVIAQIARGMANFAKCESRGTVQGLPCYLSPLNENIMLLICVSFMALAKTKLYSVAGYRKGRSLLFEDGALAWLIDNCAINSSSTRRHIELALCHLAQNGNLTACSLSYLVILF